MVIEIHREPFTDSVRPTHMTTFAFDQSTIHAHADALRDDAAALQPLPNVPVPSVWPLAEFSQALSQAVEQENARSEAFSEEASRVAFAMLKAVQAAISVDERFSNRLQAVL